MKKSHSFRDDDFKSPSSHSQENGLEKQSQEQLRSELEGALQKISELASLENRCKQAEERVSKQNDFFHQMLESLTHPFYVLDVNDYSIKVANSAARLGDLSCHPTCYG